MGILKSGILGPVINKTGPTSGRMHRGQNVISGARKKSKGKKNITSLQLETRVKFALLIDFLSFTKDLTENGFKHFARSKDPANVAYSYNFPHAFLGDKSDFSLNYPELVYSRGYILPPESPAVQIIERSIEFTWLPQRQSIYCQLTDIATFLVYDPIAKRALKNIAVTNRDSQHYRINLPTVCQGHPLHCYMSFQSKDGKLQGNSMYIAEIIVP